jgi:hypothetical protein
LCPGHRGDSARQIGAIGSREQMPGPLGFCSRWPSEREFMQDIRLETGRRAPRAQAGRIALADVRSCNREFKVLESYQWRSHQPIRGAILNCHVRPPPTTSSGNCPPAILCLSASENGLAELKGPSRDAATDVQAIHRHSRPPYALAGRVLKTWGAVPTPYTEPCQPCNDEITFP